MAWQGIQLYGIMEDRNLAEVQGGAQGSAIV